MSKKNFLADLAADEDAVLVNIIAELGEQRLRAHVIRIYGACHGIKQNDLGRQIEFVHAPTTYGNTAMKSGETAIVFLSELAGELYEASWRGHMVVEDIDGERCAIFPHLVAGTDTDDPSAQARPTPERPHASAINFALIEHHLSKLYA